MITVNRFLGWSIHFANGRHVGFNWVHGNGLTSKTSALLAGYHRPDSITWRWALYWLRPSARYWRPKLSYQVARGHGTATLSLPLIGALSLHWQPHMLRRQKGSSE